MSLPIFPSFTISREDALNQIISSIAMEELGLSHIINAEGEKLQYVLGTLTGTSGPAEPASVEDLLKINESIRSTLDGTMQNQMFLKSKMEKVLASSSSGATGTGMRGPTGPTGPTGETGATGADGAAATIETVTLERVPYSGQPYVRNEGTPYNAKLVFGIPEGEPGSTGPTGEKGDTGATGPTGEKGDKGEIGTILQPFVNSNIDTQTIQSDASVVFRSMTINGVLFNGTDTFTIVTPGVYVVECMLSLATGNTAGSYYALSINGSGVHTASNIFAGTSGQATIHYIANFPANTTIRVMNRSLFPVTLASLTGAFSSNVGGHLILYKIADGALV